MSINDTPRQKRTDDRTDPRADHFCLGRDAEGRIHHVTTGGETDEIRIIYDGRVRQRLSADAARIDIDDYMSRVEAEIGWDDREYGTGVLEALV